VQGNSLRAFWTDFSSIFRNRLAVLVFVFFIVAQFSMILTGTVQMFTYVHYMQFTAVQKSCVHGAGMIAFALAAYNVSKLVSRFDKKGAGYIGAALASFGGLGLLAVFTGGLLSPHQTLTVAGHLVPVAIIVFALLQVCWWGGCGMVVPLANSMVADVAAIEEHRTGESRNASYAAVFSFSTKAAASVGILVCGLLVDGSGIVSGAETQTAEAVRNISIITFVCGPVVILTSLLILRCYPVTREYMKQLEEEK
jgi:GPH family glycoside/pentoside/hexuronide:cation symporter